MSDNEIPDKILRTLLFAFGIQNANDCDLIEKSNPHQIARF